MRRTQVTRGAQEAHFRTLFFTMIAMATVLCLAIAAAGQML
ncbi:MAG TPA: hypothetical protein VKZ53_18740 [Candidatus Angelobacter sp.]|nr:hypothetical protein [Candidatus Angelobacter sp.]